MSFGWSAGDIISAISLLFKIGNALRSAGGASSEYQDAVEFLRTLQSTLELLKDLTPAQIEASKADHLRRYCDQIRSPLQRFLSDVVRNLDASLGKSCQHNFIVRAPREVQWALYTANKLKRFQERITVPVAAVNMLLGLQTM